MGPRQENHKTFKERDPVTLQPTGGETKADSHLTLYLGKSKNELVIQGHLYVADANSKSEVKKSGPYPLATLSEGKRTLLQDSDKKLGFTKSTVANAPTFEYWGMRGACGYQWEDIPTRST
jgi:hypothetical protein